MSQTVRAKMHCHEIILRHRTSYRSDVKQIKHSEHGYQWVDEEGNVVPHSEAQYTWSQPTVKMATVTSGTPDDSQFYEASPGGSFEITINNPQAAEMFEVGKKYYFDITVAGD